jgi:uncharacterized protein YfaS (alpha-2-macroglobulin family)
VFALGKKQDANQIVEKIADEMSGDEFQSTQGIAWALMGVSRYLGGDTSNFTAKLNQGGAANDISSDKPISSIKLAKADGQFSLENTSGVKLFATLVNRGVPKAGNEQEMQKGLKLSSVYAIRDDENPKKWYPLNGKPAIQGSDVRFSVSVTNTKKFKTDNIALTIPVAAGMEIHSAADQPTTSKIDYSDIRDDRAHYYFSLKAGETKRFSLLATAAYKGRYYLPAINVEAMYDGKMRARLKGEWINIVKTEAEFKAMVDTKPEAAANAIDAAHYEKITIKVAKAWLYDDADETTRTKMYLISGDKAEVLNSKKASDNSRWLFIRFEGKAVVEKWLRAEVTE